MDFIVARFNDTYGYISTGKDKSYGFDQSYRGIIETLRKTGDGFTYAKPDELAVHEHQREWTQKDRIFYNKLKHLYDGYNYELIKVLNMARGYER